MSALPDDPEAELRETLRQRFLELDFVESEATRLADEWADPLLVSWDMAKHGVGHHWASYIYGPGKPAKEDLDVQEDRGVFGDEQEGAGG